MLGRASWSVMVSRQNHVEPGARCEHLPVDALYTRHGYANDSEQGAE